MRSSSQFVILFSLLPATCFAALQPRPISTFPLDPHASPKFDVAFLNHLPIGRSEAEYWTGSVGAEDGSHTKGPGASSSREYEGYGRVGGETRRGRSKAQRGKDLLEVQRNARMRGQGRTAKNSNDNTGHERDLTMTIPNAPASDGSRPDPSTYPPNPLERSFLSGTPPMDAFAEALGVYSGSLNEDGVGAETEGRLLSAKVSDGVEYAYDAMVYTWTLDRAAAVEGSRRPDDLEKYPSGNGDSGPPSPTIETNPSSADFEPGSLLPSFKILKLPASHPTLPHPITPQSASNPSASSPALQTTKGSTKSGQKQTPRKPPVSPSSGTGPHSGYKEYLCMTPSVYTQRSDEALSRANRTNWLKELDEGRREAEAESAAGDGTGSGIGVDGDEAKDREKGKQEDQGKEIDPWDSLRHLEGKCLYHRQGWFTYAYCHGSHVRQFRGVTVQMGQGSPVPLEDMSFEAYNLGMSTATFDQFEANAMNRIYETDNPADYNDQDPPPMLPVDKLRVTSASVKYDADKLEKESSDLIKAYRQQRQNQPNVPDMKGKLQGKSGGGRGRAGGKDEHLALTWGYGTSCALAGLRRRQVEVQFHCRMEGVDEIAFVKETRTCQYVMIIHTPRLCGISGFHTPSPADLPSHSIKCRQIVPDDHVVQAQALREASMRVAAQKWIGNSVSEVSEEKDVALFRDGLVQTRMDHLKSIGRRIPEGIAHPPQLPEWLHDTRNKIGQIPDQGGKAVPLLEPMVVQLEGEDGQVHEITVEFVVGEDGGDGENTNEWGDEIAKLPKAKRRKLVAEQTPEAAEDPAFKKAYIAKKRAENQAKRERSEALDKEREQGGHDTNNRLSARMGKWWEGLKKRKDTSSEEEDTPEREL